MQSFKQGGIKYHFLRLWYHSAMNPGNETILRSCDFIGCYVFCSFGVLFCFFFVCNADQDLRIWFIKHFFIKKNVCKLSLMQFWTKKIIFSVVTFYSHTQEKFLDPIQFLISNLSTTSKTFALLRILDKTALYKALIWRLNLPFLKRLGSQ